jgi:hypothetical protein
MQESIPDLCRMMARNNLASYNPDLLPHEQVIFQARAENFENAIQMELSKQPETFQPKQQIEIVNPPFWFYVGAAILFGMLIGLVLAL